MSLSTQVLLQGQLPGAVSTLNNFVYLTQDKISKILPGLKNIVFSCGSGADNYQSLIFEQATGKVTSTMDVVFDFAPQPFGVLPDIFLNPIVVDNFHNYSREELNER